MLFVPNCKQQRKRNINNITLNVHYISFLAEMISLDLFLMCLTYLVCLFPSPSSLHTKKHHPTNLLSRMVQKQQEFMWSMSQEAFCHTAISSVVIVGQNRSSDIASIFLNQGSLPLNNRPDIMRIIIFIKYDSWSYTSAWKPFSPNHNITCDIQITTWFFFPVWKCID